MTSLLGRESQNGVYGRRFRGIIVNYCVGIRIRSGCIYLYSRDAHCTLRIRNARPGTDWYRMVFVSICEHASTASFIASTSNDQMCLASSEHFAEYNWRKVSTSKISPGSNFFFFSFHTVVY